LVQGEHPLYKKLIELESNVLHETGIFTRFRSKYDACAAPGDQADHPCNRQVPG
jgi:hypothetical protein